ncbi:MAG: heme A synthase [Planctomycetes bacterium]|nr:heme A synthase [Planctomycetota bacterium]
MALAALTVLLVFAGAEVKSREAGLSVPDWPLSYGKLWPNMVGGVFYEHGHRTIAATIGLLTVLLAVWTQRTESRAWVRRLAWTAVGVVCLQGLLGGLTVRYKLPPWLSASHGTLAQVFLCTVTALAYACSREFADAPARFAELRAGRTRALRAALVAVAAIFVQLLLGAWMRHNEAGLAVPFFPVSADGSLLPEHVDRLVWIHMAHRTFAIVVFALVWRAALIVPRRLPHLLDHASWLAGLVFVQGVLGASVVWTGKQPIVTSLHVANGAALLATAFLFSLRCARVPRDERPGVPEPAPAPWGEAA